MAFNNTGFPIGYQPYYPYQQMSPASISGTSQSQQSGIIWVQGEAGAKSYMVAPNTTVQLWDSENQVIYLKSADASGMPSMKVLDYKIRDMQTQAANPPVSGQPDYVTHDELLAFKEQLKKEIAGLKEAKNEQPALSHGKSR